MKKDFGRRMMSLFLGAALVSVPAVAVQGAEGDIVILYTNDVHCGIEDGIGYSGLAQYQQQMEEKYTHVTLVDAGDAIQGAPIGTLSDGGYLVEIMDQAGYDVAIPGNHEFDYGMERLLELSEELDCGYISCNLTDLRTGEAVFSPYKMIDYGTVQVAYVGISTPESLTKSTPAYFQNETGDYIYGFCEDEDGTGLYQAVQSAADAAKAAGADHVIGVAHLGETGVTPYWSSPAVIANTYGIDAVIDGHSHETTPFKLLPNKNGEEVLLTQTGTKLSNIGKMVIEADGDITAELVSEVQAAEVPAAEKNIYTVIKGDYLSKISQKKLGTWQRWPEIYDLNRSSIKDPDRIYPGMLLNIPVLAPAEPAVTQAEEMETLINGIKGRYEAELAKVLGHTEYDLTTLFPENGERAIRSSETNLGDLCADAYRTVLGTDIGLMNGGGIRADLKKGDITYNDTLTVFPYGNMICAIEVTGQQLKDALEMGAKNLPEENGAFLHVSGMTYTIDPSIPSSVVLDDKGNFAGVSGAYRVQDIMVGGAPLDPEKTYTVASHDYMLRSGGDGMTMFSGCKVLLDNVMSDVDVLSSYINEDLGGAVGEAYKDPAGQGRIVMK